MEFTPKKINLFLLAKLPSAYLMGVRMETLTQEAATVRIRHRWINQNPFKSMYFAVQAMAAELSTGVLVMREIERKKPHRISMLVASSSATFTKKATGIIQFSCLQGADVAAAVEQALHTKEGVKLVLESKGVNEAGELVSVMQFEWTLKMK